jgi:hypothetical protein
VTCYNVSVVGGVEFLAHDPAGHAGDIRDGAGECCGRPVG